MYCCLVYNSLAIPFVHELLCHMGSTVSFLIAVDKPHTKVERFLSRKYTSASRTFPYECYGINLASAVNWLI